MGKLFRFVYILLPLALTIGAFLSVCFVMAGGLSTKNTALNKNYWVRLDTFNFTNNPKTGSGIENALLASQGVGAHSPLASDYFIYFSTYCQANVTSASAADSSTIYEDIYMCNGTQKNFFFNITEVLGLNETAVGADFPKELADGIKTYSDVAVWMYVGYIVAFWLIAAEGVLGLFAICSRLVSLLVTLIATAATIFTLGAALTSTITFAALTGAVNGSLKVYGVSASMGAGQLAAAWLAVAFSLGSFFFWSFSACCCSPHSSRHRDKFERGRGNSRGAGLLAERTGGYERVASPYLGPDGRARSVSPGPRLGDLETGYSAGHRRGVSEGVPMMDIGAREKGAYEPFRHQ